jgi:hypothetical protein
MRAMIFAGGGEPLHAIEPALEPAIEHAIEPAIERAIEPAIPRAGPGQRGTLHRGGGARAVSR